MGVSAAKDILLAIGSGIVAFILLIAVILIIDAIRMGGERRKDK